MAEKIPLRLIDDKRRILCIQGAWYNDDPQVWWRIPYVYATKSNGEKLWYSNCDKIEVYDEPALSMHYFAIWKSEVIIARVPAQGLQVTYDVATEKS